MTSSLDMIRGRSNVVTLTNKSGGPLVAGDVCVIDTANDEAATTTTSAASVLKVYIAAESIADNATGKFYSAGFCPLVTPSASTTRGRYLFTHTVAKQAAESATYGSGAFGVILKSGTTPSVWLFGTTAQSSGGGGDVATDPIWDAAGDLAVGTGADTAGRLAAGAAGAVLAMGNGAVIWNAGTSFPGSKATNDRYFRTDLSLEFFWDGTRWLTTQEYLYPLISNILFATGFGADGALAYSAVDQALEPYLTTASVATYVSTTNTGSAYWTVNVQKAPTTGSATTIGSVNTSADSPNVTVPHTITINATFSRTAYPQVAVTVAKTSTPGTLYLTALVKYRLIGT